METKQQETSGDRPELLDDAPRAETLYPLAPWRVGLVACVVTLLLLMLSGSYGYFYDELYFISMGERPAWGYVDQPPFVPLLAAALHELGNGSLAVLRVPSALVTGLGVMVAALTAREMGGAARAQTTAALAYASSPFILWSGHVLSTWTFDLFLWTVVLWLVVRWVRTHDNKLLIAIGAVVALCLQVKFAIPALLGALLLAVLADGPREVLRTRALWVGAAIAVVTVIPGLLWQAANGWPQLGMAQALSSAQETQGAVSWLFTFATILGPITLVMFLHGLWALVRNPVLRPWRFLAWAIIAINITLPALGGSPYYALGTMAVCLAASAISFERASVGRWFRWLPTRTLLVISGLLLATSLLPLEPVEDLEGASHEPTQDMRLEEIGWPEFAAAAEGHYLELTPEQQDATVVMVDRYYRAGVLERFGDDLPEVHSAHRGFWTYGPPSEEADTLLYVGFDEVEELWAAHEQVTHLGTFDNGYGVENGTQGISFWLLEDRTNQWSRLWPQLYDLED